MDVKTGVVAKVLLAAAGIAVLSGAASAEVVKGTVKSVAEELRALTLQTSQESVLLVFWDNRTAWDGIGRSAGINPDEAVTVDIRQGEQAVAASISRVKPALPAGVTAVTQDALTERLKQHGTLRAVLVDTRPVEFFDRAHIPGAVSLPLSRLEKRSFNRLPENKAAGIVFYDEGQGGDAAQGAEIAVKAGFTNISVLSDGAAGWKRSNRILASSATFIRKGKPVLIDLRTPETVSRGHIEGAVNFPAAVLKEREEYFPKDKRIPIVLYSGSDEEAGAAAGTIRKWGYRNVTIFPGGAEAWQNSAEVLKTGPAESLISDTTAHSGQLFPKDFEMALISPQMVEIVDTRSAAEQKKGGFPRSIRIPLQELPRRHGELDREKIQVVFGSNPEYAEMAFDFLKSNGYRVNFLRGAVEFGAEGAYKLK